MLCAFVSPHPPAYPAMIWSWRSFLLRWRASSRCWSTYFWYWREGQKWEWGGVKWDRRRHKRWERDLNDGKKISGAGYERRSPPPKYGDLSTLVGRRWRRRSDTGCPPLFICALVYHSAPLSCSCIPQLH